MDEDDFQEEWDRTVQIGLDNLAILKLAGAWCEHVGSTTEGHLGVGMIQRVTGLPVSGGSLRCEYARGPTSFGMRLADSAVGFYEENCVGCAHRKPTTATEHLGTYADSIIAEREQQLAEAENERLGREETRRRRREARRLAFGVPDPAGQSLLDLIERVDSERGDDDAGELLLRHAEMAPGDFSDDLLAHLTDEAVAIGNTPLLESVVAVFERDGRPGVDRMVAVAFRAIVVGVAREACGRVIATHAKEFDVPDNTIGAIVDLAAGHFDFSGPHDWIGGEPGALLRLFDVDPDRAVSGIAARLTDPEPWTRSAAAHASRSIIAARPEAAIKLLPALLDATVIPDKSKYLGDPFAAGEARNVVADLVVSQTGPAVAELDKRIKEAGPAELQRLWECYDWATRSRLRDADALPPEAGRAICEAASALLNRPDPDTDLARAVADTLTVLCSYHPEARSISFAQLLGLLVAAAGRYERFEASPWVPPAGSTAEETLVEGLNRESHRVALHGVVTELRETLESAAKHDPAEFVDMVVAHGWALTASSPLARSAVVEVLGKTVRNQGHLDHVAPLLQSSLKSESNRERAEAIEAFGVMAGHELTIPAESTSAVLDAVDDKYEIVVVAVVRAIAEIEVPVDQRLRVVNFLVSFAAVLGPKRSHSNDVVHALWTAWSLSVGEPFETQAHRYIVRVVASLPSAEAAEILGRFHVTEEHPDWPIAAVAALKPDPDPQWYGIHDRERYDIMRKLATIDSTAIAPFLDELVAIGKQRTPHEPSWAWAVSDVLAQHAEHARAAIVCDAVVDAMPDTREYGPRRRYARIIAINHHLNEATARGDTAAVDKLLQEWSVLSGEIGRE
ncbi:MAG: hypothetical protein ABSE70_05035 [Candidatus Limnocylindrales bacterium]